MRCSCKKRRLFTLAEVMVTTGLGTMAMAVLMTLFLLPLRAWYTTSAEWLVDSQARLVREKMLHQIRAGQSGVGLRSASRANVLSTAGLVNCSVDQHAGTPSDLITPDTTSGDPLWYIQWSKTSMVSKDPSNQTKPMFAKGAQVTNVTFGTNTNTGGNGRVLTSTVTIQSQVRAWTYSRTIVSNVYLINP